MFPTILRALGCLFAVVPGGILSGVDGSSQDRALPVGRWQRADIGVEMEFGIPEPTHPSSLTLNKMWYQGAEIVFAPSPCQGLGPRDDGADHFWVCTMWWPKEFQEKTGFSWPPTEIRYYPERDELRLMNVPDQWRRKSDSPDPPPAERALPTEGFWVKQDSSFEIQFKHVQDRLQLVGVFSQGEKLWPIDEDSSLYIENLRRVNAGQTAFTLRWPQLTTGWELPPSKTIWTVSSKTLSEVDTGAEWQYRGAEQGPNPSKPDRKPDQAYDEAKAKADAQAKRQAEEHASAVGGAPIRLLGCPTAQHGVIGGDAHECRWGF